MDAPIEPMTDYRSMAIEFAWDLFTVDSVDKADGWQLPTTSSGRFAAEWLTEQGCFEKHPRMDWWREV
jgi:hypothetical protein